MRSDKFQRNLCGQKMFQLLTLTVSPHVCIYPGSILYAPVVYFWIFFAVFRCRHDELQPTCRPKLHLNTKQLSKFLLLWLFGPNLLVIQSNDWEGKGGRWLVGGLCVGCSWRGYWEPVVNTGMLQMGRQYLILRGNCSVHIYILSR